LNALEFDIVLSCDKSQRSAALATQVHARDKRGFGLDINGKIYPYNDGAHYNFLLGMDNELKFKRNTQTGQEYLAATFEIPYERNEYVFNFTKEEKKFIAEYRQSLGLRNDQKTVGFNTGCSTLFPNKKMTVAQHCDIIARLLNETQYNILLFGGPEDAERNLEIFEHFGGAVINTPVNTGVRRGACYMDAADVVITGDSFGMHLAIALKKFVIAWFGLSCWTEIDLYNRGVKLYPSALDCSPCWKKHCPFDLECVKMIDLDRVFSETVSYLTSIPE
jgi:heptosyltransferase-2